MNTRRLLSRLCLLACWLSASWCTAQNVQFPQASPFSAPAGQGFGGSALAPPTFSAPAPSGGFSPFGNAAIPSPTAPQFGTPTFNGAPFGGSTPYTPPSGSWFGSPQPGASSPFPNLGSWFGGGQPAQPTGGWFTPPPTPGLPPNGGAATPFTLPPANSYGGYGAAPGAPGPGGSSTLFPDGLWGSNAAGSSPWGDAFRVIQHPRISETWLFGAQKDRDLQIHDIEGAITFASPQFGFSTQPLYLTPTFVYHSWDGPHSIAGDLPPSAYSAFLDAFWTSDPSRPFGAELGVAVGVYTDFDTLVTKSIRVTGEGFGVMRLTPQLTAKLGVWYLNRNDLKLLPAGGLVWQPNPQTKFDILFPNPKFSQYLTNWRDAELWWYVSGEYGGGAWTIKRASGAGDRVDINDIRIKFGIDWMNQRNWRGYAEIGYVCDRQVVYVVNPADNFRARDTFLIGLGFSF